MATRTAVSANPLGVERLLRPRSVAIVGAAPEPGSIGGNVLANLERFGYSGELHLVSRTRKEINGRACLASIDDLPLGVDAVVLVVPEAAILDAVAACIRRQVGAAIIFASGFAETGPEGLAKQDQLARMAREGGLILNGPNCVGVANYVDGIPLTFEPLSEPSAQQCGVGVIAQSGGMTTHLRLALRAKGVRVSYTVSTGNEAVTCAEDFLAYLVDDESTRVVTLFIEQFRRPRVFLELVRRASERKKPVVLMHPGRTQQGREAVVSHTGALAGSYAVMEAALQRESVILVSSLDELIDVSALAARWPLRPSGGLAILTGSGGFKAVALDSCEELSVELARFAPSTSESLKSMLPAFATVENPLDLTTATMSNPAIYGRAAQAVLDDPGVGALLMSVIPGALPGQMARFASLLPVLSQSSKPVVFAPFGDDAPLASELVDSLRAGEVPLFRSSDRALGALARLSGFGQAMRWPETVHAAGAAPVPPLKGNGPIPEYRAKNYLRAAGIPTPDGALVSSINAALEAAARIGYPVVLKAQAAALPHKTDAGGVIAGISDASTLAGEWERLHSNISRFNSSLELEGVLIEKQAPPGVEMIVGARRDPDWGPVLMVGLGGIWAEALQDVRLMSADAAEASIVGEIRKLKGAAVLVGWRGAAPLDIQSVATTLVTLGAILRCAPEVIEIEINPLRVYREGNGMLALDALMNTIAT